NECTADFRIGVPFEQNLHSKGKYPWGNLSLICSWIFLCVSGGRKIFILRWQDKKHTSIQSHYRISI
ncbi:MAG: hypothetical protein ACLTAG_04560, partial [Mediterraneibacter gnavus]